jgi:parallel beta-helix repeat protein
MGCYAMLCDVGFYGYLEMSTFIGTSADSNRIGFDMTLKGCFLNVGAEGNTEASIRLKRSERNQIMTNTVSFGANGIELLEASSNNEITGQIYGTTNTGIGIVSTDLDMGTFTKKATGNVLKNVEFAGFEKWFDDEKKYSIIENGRQRLEKGFQQVLWFKLDEILANEVKHGETTIANTNTYSFGGGRYVGMIISKEQNVYFPATGTLTIEPIATINEQDLEYINVLPNSHSVVFTPANVSQKAFVVNPDLAIIEENQSLGVRITASSDYLSEYMKKIKIGLIVEI